MTTAYLNNEFVALAEARISPMDRGFLFGDGIYEVIPSHGGRFVGLKLHLARLQRGLDEIQL
ncbi:MAG: D-alanine aminotransferase, partial [Luminiphilus sp.]|nr:D-alanine aminotransferase [Luminiphilus sp.]